MNKSISTINKLVLSILLLTMSNCNTQTLDENIVEKSFSKNQLIEDLEVLKTELKTNHPGLYTYSTKQQIDSVFVALEQSLTSESTAIEFYRKMSMLNTIIKDAHTKVLIPEPYLVAINNSLPRFPFALHYDGEKLFVLRNLSKNNDIEIGWEIKGINGVSKSTIIEKLISFISRDGYNQSGPIAKLNYDFAGYYAIAYGCTEQFEIEFLDLNGKMSNLSIKALKVEELISIKQKKYGNSISKNPKPISYKIVENTLVLKITSFAGGTIKDAGQSYKKEFKHVFEKVKDKNIEHLIIDVRNNPGGWDEVGNELLSYLISAPFKNTRSDFSIINSVENKKYYVDNGYIKHFESLKFKKNNTGFDIIWNERPVKPKKNLFNGQLIVLINGLSASQTGIFSGLLRDKTKAIFVGEETLGNPNEACGGDIITLKLPNTKVKLEIPLRKLITDINFDSNGRGIIPDHHLKPSLQDRTKNKDNVMDFALQLINN